ncbi:MAG: PorT family protein [Acidobacteriaceae bacterium]|nr:PorT family protein [Acidobacteriaceae bacterium]
MFCIARAGLFFLVAGAACAQFPLSVGVKGGVALTDAFDNTNSSYINPGVSLVTSQIAIHDYSPSKDYLVGPFVELRLPFGLGVEADALYRKLDFAIVQSGDTTPFRFYDSTWEFPILAKYRFKLPVARPYVDAGPSFRHTQGAIDADTLSHHGFAAGAGIEINALRLLHISPEIRYTRWGSDSLSGNFIGPPHSDRNQVEFLVGISF